MYFFPSYFKGLFRYEFAECGYRTTCQFKAGHTNHSWMPDTDKVHLQSGKILVGDFDIFNKLMASTLMLLHVENVKYLTLHLVRINRLMELTRTALKNSRVKFAHCLVKKVMNIKSGA